MVGGSHSWSWDSVGEAEQIQRIQYSLEFRRENQLIQRWCVLAKAGSYQNWTWIVGMQVPKSVQLLLDHTAWSSFSFSFALCVSAPRRIRVILTARTARRKVPCLNVSRLNCCFPDVHNSTREQVHQAELQLDLFPAIGFVFVFHVMWWMADWEIWGGLCNHQMLYLL